jgi:small conductance mechanosensitive channel
VTETLIKKVARPHMVRATLAALLALSAYAVSDKSGTLDEGRRGLVDKFGEVTAGDIVAVVAAIIFVLAGIFAVRAFTRGAGSAVEQQLGAARGTPLSLTISVAGYAILILAVLTLLGVDLTGLLLGGAITGVVVGIAAQQTLGNALAGIVLLVVRPFVVGEHIVLRSGALGGEYEGRVADMGLFYVDLETERGPVKLPNAGVLAGAIGPGARTPKPVDEEDEEAATAEPAEGGTRP